MTGITSTWNLLRAHVAVLAVLVDPDRHRRRAGADQPADAGVSTLEMVIIALGLIAVATLLIAAITTAVTRRTDQIQ